MTATPPAATDAHLAEVLEQSAPDLDQEAAAAAQKAEQKVTRSASAAAQKAAAKVYEKADTAPPPPGFKNPTTKTRAVSANLLPDRTSYAVSKRGPDGDLKYIKRYQPREFIKYGNAQEFIRQYLVPRYGGGEYEIVETAQDGSEKPPVSVHIEDPEGDMAGNGAVAADVREIKTKLETPKAPSPFEEAAASAMKAMLEGGGEDGMTMEKVMMYKMMGDMFAPKGPDPALAAVLARIDAKLSEPPPMPMPSAPAVDPNALTVRDLLALQERSDGKLAEVLKAIEAGRKDDRKEMMDLIKATQKQSDPWETFMSRQRQFKQLMEEEGGGGVGKGLAELAKTARMVWTDMRTMNQGQPTQPGQPQAQGQLPAPQPEPVPAAVLAGIAAMNGAKTDRDRVTTSYELAQACGQSYPELADEFQKFVHAVVAVADANAAKNPGAIAQAKGVLTASLGEFYGFLEQRGAVTKEVAAAGMKAWETEMDAVCEMVRQQLIAARQAQEPTK
jgi:hypothetical protein